MGIYVNPIKTVFSDYVESEIYVDKSGLLKHLNQWVSKDERFVCLTRPRRFGKSMAAAMIAAYYCNAYDSHDLFDKLAVHRLKSYEQHINQYAVISFDAQELRDYVNDPMEFVPMVYRQVGGELKKLWPDAVTEGDTLGKMLKDINAATGSKFVVIIDEWDSIFRRDKTNNGTAFSGVTRQTKKPPKHGCSVCAPCSRARAQGNILRWPISPAFCR